MKGASRALLGREHRYSSSHKLTSNFRELMRLGWIFKMLQKQTQLHTHTHTHTHTLFSEQFPLSLNTTYSPSFLIDWKWNGVAPKFFRSMFPLTRNYCKKKLYKNCSKILLNSWESVISLLRGGQRIGGWKAYQNSLQKKSVLISVRREIHASHFLTVNILFSCVPLYF